MPYARPLPYTTEGLNAWTAGAYSVRNLVCARTGISHAEQGRILSYTGAYGRAAKTAFIIVRKRANGDSIGPMPDAMADEWLRALRTLRTSERVLSGQTGLSPSSEDGMALRRAADRAATKDAAPAAAPPTPAPGVEPDLGSGPAGGPVLE